MNDTKLVPRWVAASALVVGLLGGGYGLASAASGTSSASAGTTTTSTTGAKGDRQRGDETALTGDTLAEVTKAALGKVPGGKVVRAETDADGNAAYEVHMTNASGAPVTVYVAKSFEVVGVDTNVHDGHGHGGPGGGPRGDETALTGDAIAKATAAASAKVPGGKVIRAETDADGGSTYEVHMTNASGTPVTVHLDKSFAVVSVDSGSRESGPHH
jgi:uncharacterized membrane protein YkoI